MVPSAGATSRQLSPFKFDLKKGSPEVAIDRRLRESKMTGRAFSGKVTRSYSDERKFDREYFKQQDHPKSSDASGKSPVCKRWAVVTTIFEPSEAVRRQVSLQGWCLVIVADKIGMKEYHTGWFPGQGNDAVVYLTPEEQEAIKIPFIDALPWNHFGRKNVGYLYAILVHGADIIWDFDDDNLLKFWVKGAAPPGAPSLDAFVPGEHNCVNGRMEGLVPKEHNWLTYNSYPKLGAPSLPSWPHGLPLDDIKKAQSFNTTLKSVSVGCSDIAVLQSLPEYQPDVAIFRFTQPIQFWFNRSEERRPLITPTGVFTPYNAQATLHFSSGFFGLFLPVIVNSKVSDIWRSYFTQRLLWDIGAKIGFASRPLVVQDRNAHNYIKDFEGENDYMKSKQLIIFLSSGKVKEPLLLKEQKNSG